MNGVELVEAAVIGLVSYRVWRLFGADTISEPARVWLADRSQRVVDWVECPWCGGSWVAFGVAATAWASGVLSGNAVLVAVAAAALVGLIAVAADR